MVSEEQARLLEDALTVVRQQTHLMRKCLETPGKLMDALKCRYVVSDEHCFGVPPPPVGDTCMSLLITSMG